MNNSSLNYLRTLRIFFISILIMPAIFLAVTEYLLTGIQKQPTDYNDPLFYLTVAFATAGVIGSTMYYRLRIPGIKQKNTVEEKLGALKTTFIVSVAMIEAPTLFATVSLLITGYDIFLYIAVALLAVQFMNMPTREKIKNDLELDEEVARSL